MSNRNNSQPDVNTNRRHAHLGNQASLVSSHSSNSREQAQNALRSGSRLDNHSVAHSRVDNHKPAEKSVSSAVINRKAFTALLNSSSNEALGLGSRGPEVIELKKLLNATRTGAFQRKLDINSDIYDEKTKSAVEKFQKAHSLTKDLKVLSKPGLGCDGEAGKWTITALLIKNGFEVPPERRKKFIARLEQSSGERWSEEALKVERRPERNGRSQPAQDSKSQSSQPSINLTEFAREHKSPISNQRFPFQRHSYDCGPTACATAIGIVTGRNKEELAAQFRTVQGKSSMDWENPHKFARQAGVACLQLDTSNPDTIARYLKNGCAAVVSIKKGSPLTDNGHIIALNGVRGSGASMEFENLDPNVLNLPRYNVLPRNQIANEVRQVWVFGSRELLASLSEKPRYLASR